MDILDELARELSPKSGTGGRAQKTPVIPNPEISGGLGIIDAVNTDGTVQIQYQGAIFTANVTNDYTPKVGQSTLVAAYGTQVWAVGSGIIGENASVLWGGAATAQFSFNGNPNGSVLADAAGDLCVDTATPALWQALGPGRVWELVRGASTFPNITGSGNPNGVVSGSPGQWYEDLTTGILWLCTSDGFVEPWSVVNPGQGFGFYEYSGLSVEFGNRNHVTVDSGLGLAIGWDNTITDGINAVAIGVSTVTGTGIAIGVATSDVYQGVAIGYGASAGGGDGEFGDGSASIAIGSEASAGEALSIAIGSGAIVNPGSTGSIAFGEDAAVDSGTNAVAIGSGATVAADSAVALGHDASATVSDQIALGGSAAFLTLSDAFSVFVDEANADPNGIDTALEAGDLCITGTGIWQADGPGTTWSLITFDGSSVGKNVVVVPFSFSYADAGLAEGLVAYSAEGGDVLLDVWVEIDTAWDGTTPQGDVGSFLSGANGWFKTATGNPIDMTFADDDSFFGDPAIIGQPAGATGAGSDLATAAIYAAPTRILPQVFNGGNDILVTVTSSGAPRTPATVTADTTFTLPFVIVTGVNDTFIYTPASTGIPETFTAAPGTYDNPFAVAGAMYNAVGTSSDTLGQYMSDITPLGAVASFVTGGSAPTLPLTVVTGVNDQLVLHDIPPSATRTYTVAPGTYNTLVDLEIALYNAPGSSGGNLGGWVYVVDNGTELVFTQQGGGGTQGNGATLTSGTHDILADLGFTSGATFAGGTNGNLELSTAGGGNGDTISFGPTDVAADFGYTGNPDTFSGSTGDDPGASQGEATVYFKLIQAS